MLIKSFFLKFWQSVKAISMTETENCNSFKNASFSKENVQALRFSSFCCISNHNNYTDLASATSEALDNINIL